MVTGRVYTFRLIPVAERHYTRRASSIEKTSTCREDLNGWATSSEKFPHCDHGCGCRKCYRVVRFLHLRQLGRGAVGEVLRKEPPGRGALEHDRAIHRGLPDSPDRRVSVRVDGR